MAKVQDIKTPYEILIRFGEDGKPRGAHAQFIRRVTLDGELLKEELGNAEPLDLEDFPTSSLMTDATRDALAEVTRLSERVVALTEELSALKSVEPDVPEIPNLDSTESDIIKRGKKK